ncbi:putative membrane protein, partial [Bacteroides fragilis str. 3397 T10]
MNRFANESATGCLAFLYIHVAIAIEIIAITTLVIATDG